MKKIFIAMMLILVSNVSMMAEDISTYLYASYKDGASVKSALEENGFEVVGEYDAMSDDSYHLIVYTNSDLKSMSSKEGRGFAAVQKVMLSTKDNQLILTNPEYFLRAFLQDDFDKDNAQKLTSSLSSAFGEFTKSKDMLEDDDIEGYHFMMGQPYYEDMEDIAEGAGLASKFENNAASSIVFKVVLNNSTLYGVSMNTDKGEKSYIGTIKGQKNAAFLPYMVLIEDNKAKIMHPKYYLAVSYPGLSMGEFMDISDTPDDITDYLTLFMR